MKLRFIKIHPDKYRLECDRNDGTATAAELEMRGFLKHDLMHFVVENTANLQNSFYGPIARGKNLEAATPKAMEATGTPMEAEAHATEIIVANLQGGVRKEDIESRMNGLKEYFKSQSTPVPHFLTTEFIAAVTTEHQKLMIRWNNLRIGGVIELDWKE